MAKNNSIIADNDPRFKDLDHYIDSISDEEGTNLIVLQKAQGIFGFLPIEVLKHISDYKHVPLSELYGVATFYSQFTLTKRGKHTISICLGTACYVRGAQKVLDKVRDILKIEVGETTEDGLFTLENARCLGCCGLAPVMMIDEQVYANLVDLEKIPGILDKYREEEVNE
ncbi:MAG TPA: NAD(P)H-dependent oxidoreductase subunit E [Bacilli bacterium]|nr:NAD(P)H-dependent oxidoreductase subunit E [Bacilli bacterium]